MIQDELDKSFKSMQRWLDRHEEDEKFNRKIAREDRLTEKRKYMKRYRKDQKDAKSDSYYLTKMQKSDYNWQVRQGIRVPKKRTIVPKTGAEDESAS